MSENLSLRLAAPGATRLTVEFVSDELSRLRPVRKDVQADTMQLLLNRLAEAALLLPPELVPVRIAEIYSSLQGEGRLTGTPSALVRTSGCNLRCWFCDTPFTSWRPEGEDRDVAEILQAVENLKTAGGPWQAKLSAGARATLQHVIITGGEPMLHAELIPLCDQLRQQGWHITIETSGTLYLPVACDLMSISPKLASSTPVQAGAWSKRHERDRHEPAVIRRLLQEYDNQLKFVIDSPSDAAAVEDWLQEFSPLPPDHVWLMPQGVEPGELQRTAEWLVPYCRERGYHFCPRRHIEWFGPGRGT
jgi:7-carboxy-7-deazaguanine synthase